MDLIIRYISLCVSAFETRILVLKGFVASFIEKTELKSCNSKTISFVTYLSVSTCGKEFMRSCR